MGQNTLTFDPTKFIVQSQVFQGKTVKVRAFEKVVYVANPVDIVHEVMSIYIPEEYFNDETINGYTAQTAPIFSQIKWGGICPLNQLLL